VEFKSSHSTAIDSRAKPAHPAKPASSNPGTLVVAAVATTAVWGSVSLLVCVGLFHKVWGENATTAYAVVQYIAYIALVLAATSQVLLVVRGTMIERIAAVLLALALFHFYYDIASGIVSVVWLTIARIIA
jgi:hypothetical protein